MVKRYVPDAGDIVWLEFDPQAGHEQAGHRPALVLSPASYNGKSGLMVCCPLYLTGFLLISAGHSNMLHLATLQIPLLVVSLAVGLLGSLKQRWLG